MAMAGVFWSRLQGGKVNANNNSLYDNENNIK